MQRRFLRAAIFAALASVAGAAERPTSATIVVDGQFADWSSVLSNPRNVTRDGDGSSLACRDSTDRDCPLPSVGADLARFAWTWDDQALHLYAERRGDSAGSHELRVYFDTNGNGVMNSFEPVVRVDMSTGDVVSTTYIASVLGGDPLVDGQGYADGHDMPGADIFPSNLSSGSGLSPDELVHESSIPWTVLGLPPGSAFGFHVSLEDDAPPTVDDAGGPDGRMGTTAWRGVSVSPDLDVTGAPQATARLEHVVRNEGNVPSRIAVAALSSCGESVVFLRDDGTGTERYAGTDAEGDGSFAEAADVLAVGSDDDGDGRLDLGVVPAGASVALVLEHAVPEEPGTCDVLVLAEQVEDDTAADSASDVLRAGALTFSPDRSRAGIAGDSAWFGHVLRSSGTAAATTVDLSVVSAFSWAYAFFLDPDGDGDPADALPLVDTDGSGSVDVTVDAGGSADVLVRADIPSGAGNGLVETALVRASVAGATRAIVTDRTTVGPAVWLRPDYLVDRGDERHGGASEGVCFAHRLVNARSAEGQFAITGTSDAGWTVEVLTDPDGDGRPWDSAPMGGTTPPVPGNGGELDFLVRVTVPPDVVLPAQSRVRVDAVASDDPGVADVAWDDVVAAIVRTYDDQTHSVNVDAVRPCATVHALATGLPASSSAFRFVWRDGAGVATQVAACATDAAGSTSDAMTLTGGEAGPGFSVSIESFDGLTWTTLDTAAFDVEDPLEVVSLDVESPTLDRSGTLSATLALRNTSFFSGSGSFTVRWVVASPDGSTYLDATGAPAPYSGTEATRQDAVASLDRETGTTRALVIRNALFPVDGAWRVEAWLSPTCGPERLGAAAFFAVIDDADGDGLSRDAELAAGTLPDDSDSDDDGLADGEDGLGDADGDGMVDALDCDSDDDGLFDGLESGVVAPSAGTDVGRGCFVADADLATTTNEDAADTDGGGIPDGGEDRDGDGRREPPETDPQDPVDDLGTCSPSAPPAVAGLRVERSGPRLHLGWDLLADTCTGYVVLSGAAPPLVASTATLWANRHEAPVADGRRCTFFSVRAVSVVAGPGPD